MTHVALRDGPAGLQIDEQTAAGIRQWSRHFDRVTFFGMADDGASSSSAAWVDVAGLELSGRCHVEALPRGYRPVAMLRRRGSVRRRISAELPRHTHLCFTVGGLLGDWPALGARVAARRGRRYSAWIDRVEPYIIRNRLAGASVVHRVLGEAFILAGEMYTRLVLKRSSISLLQGLDTFDHYARWTPAPYCTYDTHATVEDQISAQELTSKLDRVDRGDPLRIVFVGRAAAMKGPAEWLAALEGVHRAGVPFTATWIGDGPELPAMTDFLKTSGIRAEVTLAGFEGDREVVLKAMRESDLFLFCHKTRESPRSLIEALVSGAPLVGYDSAYPRGLVDSGGGLFVQQDDVEALAQLVIDLHHDRQALHSLVESAAQSGRRYNEDEVYAHRAELMALA